MIGSLRRLLFDHSVLDFYGWNLIPVSLFVLVAAAALLGHGVVRKTLPPALLLYLGLTLLLLLTRNQTQGALRYLLVVFPVVGLAAVLLAPRRALLVGPWLAWPSSRWSCT